MAETFKPGDVVQLKSGGPKMTVNKLLPIPNEPISCRWFGKDEQHCSMVFEADVLMIYKPREIKM